MIGLWERLWNRARAPHRCRPWLLTLAYAVTCLLFVLWRLGTEPYDDAHFFKRIALNALNHGVFAWNRDEGPVYGATSQSFQLIATALAAVTRTHYMFAVKVFSAACLLSAFALLARLTFRHDRGASLVLASCSTILLFPIVTGMETALAVLVVSLLIGVLHGGLPERQVSYLAPITLALVYLTRPDAAALGLVLLAARWWTLGRRAFREIALSAALLTCILLALKAYYGTSLPLPFYAKQKAFSPYDPDFIKFTSHFGLRRFALFAISGLPLTLRALLRRDRTNLTLLVASAVFVAYHLLGTIDVMGMQGRFYVPCLPLLVLASARSAGSAVARPKLWAAAALGALFVGLVLTLRATNSLPSGKDFVLDGVPGFLTRGALWGGAALLLCAGFRRGHAWLAYGLLLHTAVFTALSLRGRPIRLLSDNQYLIRHAGRYTVYRGLDTLRACFGTKLHVYHSEVGLPGLRFHDGKVTDMVGLLSPEWLFRKISFEQACQRDRPEAIFLPHKNYQGINAEIQKSACIGHYRRMVEDSSSPLYVREDLAPRYAACAAKRKDPFVTGR